MPKCLAKKHTGGLCQNNAIKGRNRCKFHGGMSPRNNSHWNWQGKGCTKDERLRVKEINARIRRLIDLARSLGMMKAEQAF